MAGAMRSSMQSASSATSTTDPFTAARMTSRVPRGAASVTSASGPTDSALVVVDSAGDSTAEAVASVADVGAGAGPSPQPPHAATPVEDAGESETPWLLLALGAKLLGLW